MLQKPRCGTIFRLTRSASGIGEMGYVLASDGGLGRKRSPCTRRRYSAGRLSLDGAPDFAESFSAAVSTGEICREPIKPAAAALVLRNSLRFIISSFGSWRHHQATQLTHSSGLRRPIFKWTSTGLPSGKCKSHVALPGCGLAAKAPDAAETSSIP